MWRLLLLLLAAALLLAAGGLPAGAGAPVQPAEISRLNEHLVHLVETLRPALVEIRAGVDETSETSPGAAGFVLHASGLDRSRVVVTADHALPDAERLEVELFDGRRFPGRVLGRDSRADLAAVRFDGAPDLSGLPLGDSDRVRPGELVLALGHPYRLQGAVSLGIVSWIGSPAEDGLPGSEELIYTDALTHPGNSGGPLVNLSGEVIGVNTFAARNGSIGIAVPSNVVERVLREWMGRTDG